MSEGRSDLSVFNAQLLEKLLFDEYELEKKSTFNNWISKMNDLDFQKLTRSFFFELRKKYRIGEQTGPIQNRSGTLSRNLPETLKHWSDFYAVRYAGA